MKVKRYFGESLLIIFSVLFALFINRLSADYQMNKKRKIALQSITQELYQNETIIQKWKEKHIIIRNNLTDILSGKNDSLRSELEKYQFLNLGTLTNNESLIDAILTSTAWESAKSTGIVSEFDFETTQKLTHVYSMQKVLTDRTLANILDYYFNTDSHDMENLEKILIQFQLRFWELTGQEELMESLFREAIEHIEKK